MPPAASGPGEVLHPEGVLAVEGGQGLQCKESKDNTEEEVSDAEEDVSQFLLLDQHLLQDSNSSPSMWGHHGGQPHSDGDFGQDELHQPTAGGGQSEKNVVDTGSTQSSEVAPHRRGVTGVPVCKADFFKYVTFMHASNDRSFQTEYSVSAGVLSPQCVTGSVHGYELTSVLPLCVLSLRVVSVHLFWLLCCTYAYHVITLCPSVCFTSP